MAPFSQGLEPPRNPGRFSVYNLPDTKSSLASKGFDVATSTPEGLATIVREDYASWGRVIREAGVKAE